MGGCFLFRLSVSLSLSPSLCRLFNVLGCYCLFRCLENRLNPLYARCISIESFAKTACGENRPSTHLILCSFCCSVPPSASTASYTFWCGASLAVIESLEDNARKRSHNLRQSRQQCFPLYSRLESLYENGRVARDWRRGRVGTLGQESFVFTSTLSVLHLHFWLTYYSRLTTFDSKLSPLGDLFLYPISIRINYESLIILSHKKMIFFYFLKNFQSEKNHGNWNLHTDFVYAKWIFRGESAAWGHFSVPIFFGQLDNNESESQSQL